MIQPNNLRLNNLFSHQGKIKKVFSISQTGVFGTDLIDSNVASSCPMEEIEPIMLTEKWLDRFNFELDIDPVRYYRLLRLGDFILLGQDGIFAWLNRLGDFNFPVINNVHSLQNLYFAHIGKELEIKPETTQCISCGADCPLHNESLYGDPEIINGEVVHQFEGYERSLGIIRCKSCGHSFIPNKKTLAR